MGPIILTVFLLLLAAGLVLAAADLFTLPAIVILVALAVILIGGVVFGAEAARESRAGGDSWFVAVRHGIWVAVKTAFDFMF